MDAVLLEKLLIKDRKMLGKRKFFSFKCEIKEQGALAVQCVSECVNIHVFEL